MQAKMFKSVVVTALVFGLNLSITSSFAETQPNLSTPNPSVETIQQEMERLITEGLAEKVPDPSTELELGLAAYQAGNYALAFKKLQPLAEQGNSSAQTTLGILYLQGQGVTQSNAEALKWLQLAVKQGNALAQANLGNMYLEGRGVEPSAQQALSLFQQAAAQGSALGQYNLGVLNYQGSSNLAQSYTEAAKWFHLAAEQGLALAQYNLGVMYEAGEGVEQSITEAKTWYERAAKQGQAEAIQRLAE
ncbi:MAG: sel1 repeat family protein [Thiothrix sp.]|nr:MAG: sel1 repeat family protein [Thiothrix sp.]